MRGRRFLVRVRQTSVRRPGHAVPHSASTGGGGRRDALGSMALSLSGPCVRVALPAPLPRPLADHQRLRLSGHELYGLTVTAVRGCGL